MTWSTILGISSLIVLVGVIVFAFLKGDKVKKPPEGTPPDYSGGYSP